MSSRPHIFSFRPAKSRSVTHGTGRIAAMHLCVLLILLFSASCARQVPPLQEQPADVVWSVFQDKTSPAKPFFASGSLYISRDGETNRLAWSFWGNPEGTPKANDGDNTLRMDIKASLGITAAHLREQAVELLLLSPRDKRAYLYEDARSALGSFGLSIPLGLRELAAASMGRIPSLLPRTYENAVATTQGFRYDLPASAPFSAIELDGYARPTVFLGHGPFPWRAELFYQEPKPRNSSAISMLPNKIILRNGPSDKATFRIKNRELKDKPWTPDTLRLEVPPDVEIIRMFSSGILEKVRSSG